jgi:hypothetical protein
MALAGIIIIGESTGISHRVTDGSTSVCSCGFAGTYDEATEHLYGDLSPRVRESIGE